MSVSVGQKYGKLTVKEMIIPGNANQRKWLCDCDCGGTKITSEDNLRRGRCKSCGCLYKMNGGSKKRNIYMGSDSKLYRVWSGIKSRCFNENNHNYCFYGGRGITMCEEWKEYGNFKDWALESGYTENTILSIERIDVNGNYEPNNCKWATFREQANNRRTNTVVGYNGEEKTLSQWAECLGMNYSTFMSRYSRGWSIERIITQPVKRKFRGREKCRLS